MPNEVDAATPLLNRVLTLHVAGIPVRLHWTTPLPGLLLAFAGVRMLSQLLWLVVGYVLVMVIHHAAHVVAARRCGLKVHAVNLVGVGGRSYISPTLSARHALIVYSAGFAAQALLAAVTLVAVRFVPGHWGIAASCLGAAFTWGNVVVAAGCLAATRRERPTQPDGRVLLQVLADKLRGRTFVMVGVPGFRPHAQTPVFEQGESLLERRGFAPPGFRHGIEVLNDTTSPMDFVMRMFTAHFGWAADVALRRTVEIHNRGGLLVAFHERESADRVARAMCQEAAEAGWSFTCKAVSLEA